jgi:putative chitinase
VAAPAPAIDPARLRQSIALFRAELDALEALLAAEVANDALNPAPEPQSPGAAAVRALPAPPNPSGGLKDAAAFYSDLRASDAVFGGRLTADQVAGVQALIEVGAGRLPRAWMAYVLATAYHETGHVMVPVRERGSGRDADRDGLDDYLEQYDTGAKAARLGNTPEADGDGVRYAGRGQVQLTGTANYARATTRLRALGVLAESEDLTATPDLVLEPFVGAVITVLGMLEGWFTGRKLRDHLPAAPTRAQYREARRIVNGMDRADLIAGYALAFDAALAAGQWG